MEPEYYAKNGLSPLEAFKQGLLSREEYVGFCKGNVIKYIVRAGKKGDAKQDLLKAINYCNKLIEITEEKPSSELSEDFKQYLRNNPMPTDCNNKEDYYTVECCCKRKGD